MATSEFWQRVSASVTTSPEWVQGTTASSTRHSRGTAKLWMALDGITVLGAAVLARSTNCIPAPLREQGILARHADSRPLDGDPARLLCGFAITLVMTSRRLHLYTPSRLNSILHEQRLSVQACFTSGLLLTGTLYLVKAEDIPAQHRADHRGAGDRFAQLAPARLSHGALSPLRARQRYAQRADRRHRP